MYGKAQILADLRQRTGSQELSEKQLWSAPNFPAGVPKGCLVELCGSARTEWLLALFNLHPEHYIFWCEKESLVLPTAIRQRGVYLDRIKFIQSKKDLQQPLRLALESQLYPFIVAPQTFDEVRVFQRLSLLAEKSKSTIFFLPKQEFSIAWPISLQISINLNNSNFQIEVLKQKHKNKENRL